MDFSNPNGEAFDPEGIPQHGRGCPFWLENHPIDRHSDGL